VLSRSRVDEDLDGELSGAERILASTVTIGVRPAYWGALGPDVFDSRHASGEGRRMA